MPFAEDVPEYSPQSFIVPIRMCVSGTSLLLTLPLELTTHIHALVMYVLY